MKTIEKHVVLSEDAKTTLLQVLNGKPVFEEKQVSGKGEKKIILSGKNPKAILHANILLMSSNSVTPKKVAESLSTSQETVREVKNRFFNLGVPQCLVRKNAGKAPYPPKITGEVEANITKIACSQTPDGRSRWTLALIADKAVELKVINAISRTSVGTVLKKTNLSLT